jgi:hypothetical protein
VIAVRRPTAFVALTGAIVAALTTAGSAGQVVELRLRGYYFSAPATVIMTVAIEPDDQNTMLRIEADGDRFYRSSELELSGASEKRIHSVEFKNLPEGSYTLRAEVRSKSEVRGQATQELTVMGVGGQ